MVQERRVQVIVRFLQAEKIVLSVPRWAALDAGATHVQLTLLSRYKTKYCSFTHIEVSDVRIVLSELPESDRKALHKTTALVVAHGTAQGVAEDKRENQDAQEERPRSHGGAQAAEVFWLQRNEEWLLGR